MKYKRVHGDVEIVRRDIKISNYKQAKSDLELDFHNTCGYCGKRFDITLTKSQIDHFIPKRRFPQFENEYSNLVLCCPICNNKKHEDWPSDDPSLNITSDGMRGYIDPTDKEFDANIARKEDGTIVGLSNIGKYMVKRLGFENRPIKECFRAQELCVLITILKEKNRIDGELAELLLELEDIRQILFKYKE